MYPYLISATIFGHAVRVPTYGVMLALAFSAGYFTCLYRTMKLGESPAHIENLFLLVVVASVVGSRGFHVLFEEPSFYWNHPGKIFAIWEGGYTFYGAMLASVAVLFVYCWRTKIDYLTFGDIAAPATALGLCIGRVGCFAAGCCWGKPTSSFLGVTYTHPDSFAAVKGIPLHPTQLYESLGALFIFFYLTWRFRNRQYPGQIFFHGLLIYAVMRFLVEIFRGDDYRGYLFNGLLSYSQFISLAIFAVAAVSIFRFGRKRTA